MCLFQQSPSIKHLHKLIFWVKFTVSYRFKTVWTLLVDPQALLWSLVLLSQPCFLHTFLSLMHHVSVLQLQSLLEDFDHPIRVELVSVEPVGNKTETVFVSFDASQNKSAPLPFDKQWEYFHTLNASDITVADWVIYWDGESKTNPLVESEIFYKAQIDVWVLSHLFVFTGPDLCASSQHTLCPQNSLCINTLGSYICVCKHGYYDVSAFITPHVASHPVCNGKKLLPLSGLFFLFWNCCQSG